MPKIRGKAPCRTHRRQPKMLVAYHIVMFLTRILYRKGVLEKKDVVAVENKAAQKYGLEQGSVHRDIDLINNCFKAFMFRERG